MSEELIQNDLSNYGKELVHSGIKGMKKGVRRWTNPDGTLNEAGKERYYNSVFISGTTKTHEEGPYKRDDLPKPIKEKIDSYMKDNRKILVGDAPGIDSQVQDYLAGNNYKNVEVFVSGDEVRKNAGDKLKWKVNQVDGEGYEKYSKEWRAVKDKRMNQLAKEGLAIVIKGGSGATRNNVRRFLDAGKKVAMYQLDDESFVDEIENMLEYDRMKHEDVDEFLAHYGIKGQEWGKRRFQNEDGSLTAEGRIRYGYNPKFSNLTDKELQDEINKKRTQSQYIDLMTRDSKKRQQEKDALIKEIGKFGSTAVDVYDKTTLEGFRNYMNSEKMRLGQENKALNDEKKLAGTSVARKAKIDELIAANNEQIKGWKATEDAQKDAIDKFKAVSSTTSQAVDFERKFFPDSKEVKADKQTAAENISELEPDQLKKIVDRMLLEKQYEELVNPPKKSRVEKGREVLQTIGALAGVALTVANLAKILRKDSTASQSDEDEEYLAHYGVKGMKKGVRRWTYEDGSLTPEGYRHYGIDPNTDRPKEKPSEKEQAKQRAYTQKIKQRQALKEARNNVKIREIYDRQQLRSEAESRKIQNKYDNESIANVRKNIVKGVASVALIASAMYAGRHFLRERSLDNQYLRDVGKITAQSRSRIDEMKAEMKKIQATDLNIIKEKNRSSEAKRQMRLNSSKEKLQMLFDSKKAKTDLKAKELDLKQHTIDKIFEDAANERSNILGAQGAYLNTAKNVTENTTLKAGKALEDISRNAYEREALGAAAESGRRIVGNAYGGNVNITVEGNSGGNGGNGGKQQNSSRRSRGMSEVQRTQSESLRSQVVDMMSDTNKNFQIGSYELSNTALQNLVESGKRSTSLIEQLFGKKKRR